MQISLPRRFSPSSHRLLRSVEHFCRDVLCLPRGAQLLLAVSGGADSCALAVIMHVLAPRLGLTLHACSVDHGLRPEAVSDALYARQLCISLDIPCTICQAKVRDYAATHRLGIEDAGRHLRYALLEQQRVHYRAEWIALGHHAGDVSEDVLLRLVRGTGWPALGGMQGRDPIRHIMRPLLSADPAELRGLLKECHIDWREDSSNADLHFRRNRLRHAVLPLLRAENPALDRSLNSLWQLAQLDADYWKTQLNAILTDCPWQEEADGLLLPAELLQHLLPAIRLRLYMHAIQHLCTLQHPGAKGQARARTLFALDAALSQRHGNMRFQLPGGIEALLIRGGIRFSLAKTRKRPEV
ncbi:MAG: tRNA lysidine(34) synthetase TilS [Desulfovibrio sp.]|nr:tRNA lysidine(34) synthetase TilS [Desulfovibrio sp.]